MRNKGLTAIVVLACAALAFAACKTPDAVDIDPTTSVSVDGATTLGSIADTVAAPPLTASPVTVAEFDTLTEGDRGAAVEDLQQGLTDMGFSPGVVDGWYGETTTKSVAEFQQLAGLPVTGVADSGTRNAVELLRGSVQIVTTTTVPATTTTTAATVTTAATTATS